MNKNTRWNSKAIIYNGKSLQKSSILATEKYESKSPEIYTSKKTEKGSSNDFNRFVNRTKRNENSEYSIKANLASNSIPEVKQKINGILLQSAIELATKNTNMTKKQLVKIARNLGEVSVVVRQLFIDIQTEMVQFMEGFRLQLTELSLSFLNQPPILEKLEDFSERGSFSPKQRRCLPELNLSTQGSHISLELTKQQKNQNQKDSPQFKGFFENFRKKIMGTKATESHIFEQEKTESTAKHEKQKNLEIRTSKNISAPRMRVTRMTSLFSDRDRQCKSRTTNINAREHSRSISKEIRKISSALGRMKGILDVNNEEAIHF